MKCLTKNSVHPVSSIQKNIFGKIFRGSKNILFKIALLMFGLVSMLGSTHALFNGTVGLDLGFDTGSPVEFDDYVRVMAVQSDGKILMAGNFTMMGGIATNYIIRINSDGTRDDTFTIGAGFNGTVYSMALQSDGKIIVGGNFTTYAGSSAVRIIRLNTDGTRDTSFTMGAGFNVVAYAIKIQSDGKVIVGGNFTTYSGATSNRIIRLNTDGTRDTSFTIGGGFDAYVYPNALAIQPDGKIVVGGLFTTYSGASSKYIIRLNADGTRDTSFTVGSGFNGYVRSLVLQSDGKILVGGNFTTYAGSVAVRLIRINSDGTRDTSFGGNGCNGIVYSLTLQTGGKIIAGGAFTTYSGVSAKYIVSINSNGTRDTSFDIGTSFDSTVYTTIAQSDGKVLAGGLFTQYNGQSANKIIRLNTDGTKDTFIPGDGFNSYIRLQAIQSDGKILVGGNFTAYGGVMVNYITRLNTDGSKDASFAIGSSFDDVVQAIDIQSDGKILVGGDFTTYSGTTSNRIIRLNSDGTRDTSFIIGGGFSAVVYAIKTQSDGKILVGGNFTTYSGATSNRIIRLNTDGTRDTSFTIGVGFSTYVYALALQDDGKILVGGNFTNYSGASVNYITRLNTDGTKDTSFTAGTSFNGIVATLALQSDGKIVVGGYFTTYSGVASNRIVRLNTDGILDTGFTIGVGFNSTVFSLALQSDGKIVVGGQFTTFAGSAANSITRLNTDGTKDTTFTIGVGFDDLVYTVGIQNDNRISAGGNFHSYDGTLVGFFTSLYILTAPTLVSPLSGSVPSTSNVDLIRSPSTGGGISGYTYQVSTDSGFATFITSGTTNTTGISLTGFTEGPYYRRVVAFDTTGNIGGRSDIRNFTVDFPSAMSFTGANPPDNAWINASSFTAQLDITQTYLRQFQRSRSGVNYSLYDSGLVLMLNFDKVSALGETDGLIRDVSQYANNGSGYGGVTWTGDGKYGGAYNFGGDKVISFPVASFNTIFAGSNKQFSISAWVKPDSNNLAQGVIVGRYAFTETQCQFLFRIHTNSKPAFTWYGALNGTTYRGTLGSTPITDTTKWYHVVATYDGTIATINNRVALYVDGVAETTSIHQTAGTPSTLPSSTVQLGIGSSAKIAGTVDNTVHSLSGSVDEVRIYSHILTSGEIAALYASNLKKYDTNRRDFTILQTGMFPGSSYGYSGIVTDLSTTISTGRTIGYTTPIEAPLLSSPLSGALLNSSTETFLRNPSSGVNMSGYIYQVSMDSGFTTFVASGSTTTTGVSLSGFTDGRYYRRVVAYDIGGNLGYRSETWEFDIDLPSVMIFTGATPANNTWISTNSFTAQLDITETYFNQFSRLRSGVTYSLYDSGLILMLNLDKVSTLGETDGLIRDVSQYGNNGSGYGGIVWTGDGKWNGGYRLDGSSTYISLGDILDSEIAGADQQFTMSARINIDDLSSAVQGIMYKLGDGACSLDQRQYSFRISNSKLSFVWYGSLTLPSAYRGTVGNTTLTTGQRYQVSIVYDGTIATINDRVALYVDGVAETTSIESSAGTPSYIQNGTSHLGIGARLKTNGLLCTSVAAFPGKIDEVRIYNRILTSGEIAVLYASNLNKYDTTKWNFTILQTGMLPGISYGYSGTVIDSINTASTGRTIARDGVGPIFTFADNSGPECSAGVLTITSPSDAGIGLHDTSPYSFNGVAWNLTASTSITAQQAGSQVRTGRVRDQFENSTYHTATYTFTDVAPTANDFTGSASVANTAKSADRKTLSSATEGDCGADDIIYDSIHSQGAKGTCSVVGDTITYTPDADQVGNDACTLRIKDNENITKDIVVSRGNIDTSRPSSPLLLSPASGTSLTTGTVTLLRSGSADLGVGLSGYLWQLSTGSNFATLISGGFATTTGVIISGLNTATYYRRVYAVDLVGNTGDRSSSRNFTIAPAISFAIESPGSLALGTISVPETTQVVEKIFTGSEDYFVLSDYIGDDQGYYTTLSMSSMTNGNGASLSNQNIAIKSASSIVTLAGSENPNVTSAIGGSYITFGNNVLTFIKRDPGSNGGLIGTYGISPALKVTIPELQNSGNYSGTLIYTIYPN